jgi:hypothetical protein
VTDNQDFSDADGLTSFASEADASDPTTDGPKAVPPPVASEIDALLEAVSATGRASCTPRPVHEDTRAAGREPSILVVWKPVVVRWRRERDHRTPLAST